jgi:Holliday junction resolvase RusA-like endonuclease
MEEVGMIELRLTIPLEPPTVNHYVKHTRMGRHYITKQAQDWLKTVSLFANGMHVEGKEHFISYTVYQGHGSRGDVDNYAKCVIDSLVKAGVLKTDSSVIEMNAKKQRDRDNPRTEILVRAVK